MAGITAGRLEARFEEVSGRVVGGQQQDVASLGGRAIGQGRAARDAGGQGEGHEGEAGARGSIEQGEVTEGNATGPQPGEGLVRHLIEEADSGLGSRRFLSLLLLFEGAFVVGHVALEVAADEVVHVSGFHLSSPFGVMPCALEKGSGDGTMVEVVGDEIIVHKISSGEGLGSGTMIEGCQALVRRMCVTWPDFSFLMFSITEGENKRGAKAESTPL